MQVNNITNSVSARPEIIRLLECFGGLLEQKKGMQNQSQAYRKAAFELEKMDKDPCSLSFVELDDIPFVGKVIASEIKEYCDTGTVKYLERVLHTSDPRVVLMLAPGVGEEKANNLVNTLEVNSFSELLVEYEEGRIAKYLGRESVTFNNVSNLLEFLPSWVKEKHKAESELRDFRPETSELLDYDDRYRASYKYGPSQNATLTVEFKGGTLKTFFSESQKAKRLGKIGDWVNIHYERNGEFLKWVVLTSQFGSLKGKRIVLGEESACKAYYLIKGGKL